MVATKKHHSTSSTPLSAPPPVESMPGATVSGSHSSDTLKTHASWGRGKKNTPVNTEGERDHCPLARPTAKDVSVAEKGPSLIPGM